MKELTRVPSELILLAVKDMKATIKQGYTIDMYNWGINIGTPECQVCMAGAVMLQHNRKSEKFQEVSMFNVVESKNSNQYYFLDEIRQGRLKEALFYLGIYNLNSKYEMEFPLPVSNILDWKLWHECEPKVFYKQCKDLAKFLKSKGH